MASQRPGFAYKMWAVLYTRPRSPQGIYGLQTSRGVGGGSRKEATASQAWALRPSGHLYSAAGLLSLMGEKVPFLSSSPEPGCQGLHGVPPDS